MSKAIKVEEDFTAAMQQLSAEAEKTLPAEETARDKEREKVKR